MKGKGLCGSAFIGLNLDFPRSQFFLKDYPFLPITLEDDILRRFPVMSLALNAALSALDAYGKKVDVTANNIANLNTDGFKKSRAVMQEADSSGVVVSISKVNTPGAPIPSEDGTGSVRESSNVDPAEEIVNLQTAKHGFEANLKTLKVENEMLGSLFDILG
jgi:flagellar basal body rod protein FlgG